MTTSASRDALTALAAEASERLAGADAGEVLRWAVERFGDDLVVASNMQDAVLIDLAAKVKPDIDVLFLDTGYHFAETIGTRDAVATVYPDIRIVNARPDLTVAEQDTEYGPELHDRDPNRCCHLRKVIPLRRTLARYSCWITGVRRVDAPTRADTPVVMWDDRNGLVKVNPIAAWTDEQFEDYIQRHGILQNPLVGEGYLSIGCAPCTAKVAPGADPRSGRWAGTSKTECGLHA
ncbi:phosphoadenylyl-sulfate reductase [Saccharomonospora xinjiangensis]|uniref:phosphoadenylyl-sulfate reductase n=1 Tax=Saccharomonospora xinjiangensis TaxID=75294 RepID=UPI00106F81D3|nr:phosphoadenylyl-sulfate reductase [Saccharomonospora xinjiangensis]QBQ59759.1 Phosphoadenosine phosphosulfate reductase [Saccharomonospora xinjiangensis]